MTLFFKVEYSITANCFLLLSLRFSFCNFSVVAKDNNDVFSPVIELTPVICSGCSNHGTCNFTDFRQTQDNATNFELAVCVCDLPWDGKCVLVIFLHIHVHVASFCTCLILNV